MTSLPLTSLAWRGDGQLATKTRFFLCSSRISRLTTETLKSNDCFSDKTARFLKLRRNKRTLNGWLARPVKGNRSAATHISLSLFLISIEQYRKNNLSLHTSEVHKSHRLKRPIGIGCIHNHPVSRFIACQHLNLNQEGDSTQGERPASILAQKQIRKWSSVPLEGTG